FLLLELALGQKREEVKKESRVLTYDLGSSLPAHLLTALPFSLTPAQLRVLQEIRQDLASPHPMNRLIQGDVGSGKTVVSVLAMLAAVGSGYQAALMAPTEILAEQHKFGVLQRAVLKKKGYAADVLVMTATPIPRTLALTVYGDLDVLVIDTLPPGRRPVRTLLFAETQRARLYRLVEDELSRGRQ